MEKCHQISDSRLDSNPLFVVYEDETTSKDTIPRYYGEDASNNWTETWPNVASESLQIKTSQS